MRMDEMHRLWDASCVLQVGHLDSLVDVTASQWVGIGLVLPTLGLPLVGAALGTAHLPLPGLASRLLLCYIGLALQGACLGCVVTMVQPLLASLATSRGDPSVAPLLAISDSAQSVGFIVGPLLGSAFVRHIGALNLGLAALSLGLSLTLRVCFKGAGLQSEGRHTEV